MSQDYHWAKKGKDEKCARAEVFAHELQAERESHEVNLANVTLKLFNKACTSYDLVESAAAKLSETDRRLFSEGAVKITLNLPAQGQPEHKPVVVESSGVLFDVDSGRAETDKPTHFVFERGEGRSVGAVYDPTNRQLELKSAVEINWKSAAPNAKPMKIEAGNLVYREATAEVFLTPWGRMTREGTSMEGQNVVVKLQIDGSGPTARHNVKQVKADHAHGTEDDTQRKRKLNYAADLLVVDYNGAGQVQNIGARGNAHMVSAAETSETTVNANHVEMAFAVENKESHLSRVAADGHGEVTQKPVPVAGRESPDTHVLRSETLDMKMRPGGRDIESVVTNSPGTLDFLPNAPTHHRRTLDASRMNILYGAQNHIQQFNATDAKTRTEPTAEEKKRNRGISTTASKDLIAHFDPRTGSLSNMEQTGAFHYEENDRKASAAKATLDNDVIVLDSKASMSDATSKTTADRIRMDQHGGDFSADGNVKSSRIPDRDPKKNSEMLNGDDPLQAEAQHMESHDQNHVFRYTGNVVMWQGSNQIKAETVDVDRRKKLLKADGHVITTFYDQPKKTDTTATASAKNSKPAAPKPPTRTVVTAPHLTYTDDDRLAVYTGGVILDHAGTHVTSTKLDAHLADSDADSRLENAVADGNVEIKWNNPTRSRVGTSQHAEYYTADQKVLLSGGRARFVDSCKGATEGDKLTYFANDDRLLVNGNPSQPAQSRLDRSCK
jgi:lipopolysaccharide export system protein LptA